MKIRTVIVLAILCGIALACLGRVSQSAIKASAQAEVSNDDRAADIEFGGRTLADTPHNRELTSKK